MAIDVRDQAAVKSVEIEPATTARPAQRLRWLDALRGVAVLAVVYEHFSTYLIPDLKIATSQWAHAGTFGVMLFFLVSGYIVPASIERRGSVRDFWIGRLFRLYPAFAVTVALAVLIGTTGLGRLPGDFDDQTGTYLLGHLTMLHEVVGTENIQNQFWTLAYEMAFYLLVTAVFVFGVHRFSAEIAALLAAAALALGGLLPTRLLAADGLALRNITVLTALVLLLGVIAVSNRRRAMTVGGAVLLGALVLGLLGVNQRDGGWEGFIILAVMFTGTALFRAEQGQIARVRAALAVLAVAGAAAGAVFLHGGMWHMANAELFPVERSWLGGMLLAFVVFGIGMLLRHRRVPAWLSWLGAVSYSVYLLHYVVIYLTEGWVTPFTDAVWWQRSLVAAAYLGILLVASWAMYRLVELPFQSLGRRAVKWVAQRA